METRFKFQDYQWMYLAVSTVTCLIGSLPQLLVFIFTTQSSKNDNRSYLILIKTLSIMTTFGFFTAYFIGVRSEFVSIYLVYVPYGPSRYFLPPRWIALLDSWNIQLMPIGSMLLATMMVFRALIMFNFRFKKSVVYFVLLLIFLITFPLNLIFARSYVPLEEIPLVNASQLLIEELKFGPCYGIQFDDILNLLWDFSHLLAVGSVLTGFITLLLMMWKLHSLRNSLAKETRKLHIAFMMLLSLDQIIMVVLFIIIGSVYNIFPQYVADFVVMFTCPIVALSGGLQGIMSLIFVPYLRAAFLRMLKGKEGGNSSFPGLPVVPRSLSIGKGTF